MSSLLVIASVTQVIRGMLDNGLNDPGLLGVASLGAVATALPLDRIDTEADEEVNQLNLFMYMASTNAGWRNQGFPSLDSQGARISNPPLALDLYYVLTAFGDQESNSDILLGYGMQLLHKNPVLGRDLIRTLLTPVAAGGTLPDRLSGLEGSGLAEQAEQIKITPETLNTEEVSRLWTAFGSKYRPSAFYRVTVVLIESKKPARVALPVQRPLLYVRPFQQPVIEKVGSRTAPDAPTRYDQKILPGHYLVVSGKQLRGEIVSVRVGGVVENNFTSISDTQILFPIPASLGAGIHGVRVIHEIAMGSPPTPHRGFSSNVEAFVLSPLITEPISDIGPGRIALLAVTPPVGDDQKVVLLLNELSMGSPPSIPRAYSFEYSPEVPLSPPAPPGMIGIPVPGVEAGAYLVRVRVDDAESPVGPSYNSPIVNVT